MAKNAGGDTSIGGPPAGFPRTTWGLVTRCCRSGEEPPRADLEDLCRRYWKPVYRFLRMTRARSNEDAKDLTQAFFLWLLEGDALSKYAPERGSFRRYLKVLLGSFAGAQEKALTRVKRGGGRPLLTLDDADLPMSEVIPDPGAVDPGLAFDRSWALEAARHAIDRVRKRLDAAGRTVQFRVYEAYDLAAGTPPTYAEIASRLGLSVDEVHHHLTMARDAVLAELRAELTAQAGDLSGVDEEWNELFGA